ncbi:hypothetical protein AAFF_G00209970 [Aldrovandia affinis]|uniref:ribonuclease H n=1 Tax=Aldrovandia affinis TaxID=143900 RepID=A0AAD7SYA5_9TELE|nr:hypothetical protein AAFF_G00209970 [Aldrovandia affinis]
MHPREAVYSGLSSLLSEEDQYLRLLADSRTSPSPPSMRPPSNTGRAPHRHQGPPVSTPEPGASAAKLAVAKAEFAHMEQVGIIRRSDSPWASPLHIVAKPGGGWRPCGDYRRLNDATTPDRYPVPHIQDFSAHLSDDILIASATEEEHLSHLQALFTRLSQHGLIVNPAKCLFGRGTIEFLGHRITCEGAVPLPSKVEAVAAFPRPLTARSLREFIGMVTFYHRFIPRAAHTLRPLYEALKGKSPNQAIEWTAEREGAFKDTKAALAQAAMLAHPSHTAPIAITTDASDYAVGAVYEQWVGGAWQPLAFFSHQLSPSERKYSTFDRELLGLWLAIRHFRFLLEGREFTAYVDHKPLTFAMSKAAEPWSARQQRQFSFISEFTTDIQHVAGKSNLVADCLSRAVVGRSSWA